MLQGAELLRVDEIHTGVVRELGISAMGGEAGPEGDRCDVGVVEVMRRCFCERGVVESEDLVREVEIVQVSTFTALRQRTELCREEFDRFECEDVCAAGPPVGACRKRATGERRHGWDLIEVDLYFDAATDCTEARVGEVLVQSVPRCLWVLADPEADTFSDVAQSSAELAHVVVLDGKSIGDVVEVFAVPACTGEEQLVQARTTALCQDVAEVRVVGDFDRDSGHDEVLFDLLIVGPRMCRSPGGEGIRRDHRSGSTVVFTSTFQSSLTLPVRGLFDARSVGCPW